ncbi:transglutaminase family protein [Brevibacterium litoralis]|uniref:transglutaminase family protein n=1 Tax=Brevibacterium litoralis TaxID=3138935 RepID=UPI0032ECF8C2
MKRLRIEHRTGFRYPGDVSASYNEARMQPVTSDAQFVLHHSLDIEPHTAVATFVDYFGSAVTSFDVVHVHASLTLTARCLVEVRARELAAVDLTWDDLSTLACGQVETVEQLVQTGLTAPPAAVVALAKEIAGKNPNPDEAAREIARTIGEEIEYLAGVTNVHTTAADAWAAGRGVCQDITHVALGALRSVGIPARYVSGYLHPVEEPVVGETVSGESHAWLEWYVGEWRGYDPTNRIEIGDRHVTVGRGRDYTDVPPLRGVYSGAGKSELDVSVTITREA